jgi:hypothetical protein
MNEYIPIAREVVAGNFGYDNLVAFGNLNVRHDKIDHTVEGKWLTKISSSSTKVKDRALIRALCSSVSSLR